MATMITPITIWNELDLSLDTNAQILNTVEKDDIKIEYVKISGRDCGDGRVGIYLAFANSISSPYQDGILILPDKKMGINEDIISMYVEKGYAVCMVDYRGKCDQEHYTEYPESVAYANVRKNVKFMDFVSDSADKTAWYEWGAVAMYARKYLVERIESENVALLGIRCGGEIAWKILNEVSFKCAVTVCAAGWLAYRGYPKFDGREPDLDGERYRYIAGIDSQAYAPYVKCPIFMMCTVNDYKFDCDRAFDTFSRINPDYIDDSAITYSLMEGGCISSDSTQCMFMFLDKHVKNRQIFIPYPTETTIATDEKQNLTAIATADDRGQIDKCLLYFAEDCAEPALREWRCAELFETDENQFTFGLDIYEKAKQVYVLCGVTYSNGFTAWSRVIMRKISGSFRNSRASCNVLYSGKDGVDCFTLADFSKYAVGGIFMSDKSVTPHLVEKENGVVGLYSPCGLETYRMNSGLYAANISSLLKLDVFTDEECEVILSILNFETKEEYLYTFNSLGGVWQSVILESKSFKTEQGIHLSNYLGKLCFKITCAKQYAINNVMWL